MAAKKQAELKLVPTGTPVEEFVAGVENPRRRGDAEELVRLLREVTGEEPVVWTYGIVGFGDHHYRHDSGREGDTMRIGFAPRKANLALYGFNSAPGAPALLARLGKHKEGASCVYVNRLADVDMDVLRELARLGDEHLRASTASFVPR
jgi:hypothetical protein